MKENPAEENFALILNLPSWKMEVQTESRNPWGSHCWLITGWPRPTGLDLDQQDGFLCHTEAAGFSVTLHSNTDEGNRFYTCRGKGLRPFCGFCSNSSQRSIFFFPNGFCKTPAKGLYCSSIEKKQKKLSDNLETK